MLSINSVLTYKYLLLKADKFGACNWATLDALDRIVRGSGIDYGQRPSSKAAAYLLYDAFGASSVCNRKIDTFLTEALAKLDQTDLEQIEKLLDEDLIMMSSCSGKSSFDPDRKCFFLETTISILSNRIANSNKELSARGVFDPVIWSKFYLSSILEPCRT